VVDLANLRAALMGEGSGEKGLGFKSLNDF
jgi:hypothetical protein